jgi:hypothetical protein
MSFVDNGLVSSSVAESLARDLAAMRNERDVLKANVTELQAELGNLRYCLKRCADGERALRMQLAIAQGGVAGWKSRAEAAEKLLKTPELHDFARGVVLEAAYQIYRWGVEDRKNKTPTDYFWLVGYLAGKALRAALAGDTDKALHHCISTAAALANWHASLKGAFTVKAGIDAPEGEVTA